MMVEGLHYKINIDQGHIQNQGVISHQVGVESVDRLGTEIIIINNNNALMCPTKQLQNPTIGVTNIIIITQKEVI